MSLLNTVYMFVLRKQPQIMFAAYKINIKEEVYKEEVDKENR